MNKFYTVKDKNNYEGFSNIVSAPTAREAKKIGSHTEFTQDLEQWTDLEAKAIKGGNGFYYDENYIGLPGSFEITGNGFVYTDLPSGLIDFFTGFIPELEKQKRIEWEVEVE